MKNSLLFAMLFFKAHIILCQPAFQWQRALGGTGGEDGFSIQQTIDGGYIVAGFATSFDGDVSGGHGSTDCWIVKLNADGAIEWQKMYGGTGTERAAAIQQTSDSGYVFVGRTNSNDGDVSGNHGELDVWVVKLTANGTLVWQKTFGGSEDDEGEAVLETPDGGYIVAGHTESSNGDVNDNNGVLDIWVIKLNKTGLIEWEKTYGGSNAEYSYSICISGDNGYIIAGQTKSNDGDVSGNNGNTDVWVIKISSTGALEWQNAMGGVGIEAAYKIVPTWDEGYILTGVTASGSTGDVMGSHGLFECWLVKLDNTGEIVWQKPLGGSDNDYGRSVAITDDGSIVVGGVTTSFDGDVTSNNWLGYNWWVIKLSPNGEILWDRVYGGSGIEEMRDLALTTDGGVIITGHTYSNDGDVTGFHGGIDVWVVKLSADSVSSVFQPAVAAELAVYPNPAAERLWLDFPQGETSFEVRLTDALGRVLGQQTVSAGEWLDISRLPAGLYYLDALGARGQRYATRFGKE